MPRYLTRDAEKFQPRPFEPVPDAVYVAIDILCAAADGASMAADQIRASIAALQVVTDHSD